MDYRNLGRSGLSVSPLCLGTMNFGWKCEEAEAHAIMDLALECGISFFDTADIYYWGEHRGKTEEIIGRWFAGGGGRRERTVLATKVYEPMGDGPNQSRLSALHIRRALDASLRRLKTDYIDLYQFHHIDRTTPWDEIWQAIDIAVRQGKILYVGSSNFAGWHIATAQASANRLGLPGLVSEQSIYNLITRLPELEVLPSARHHGLGIISWSPLQGGLLGGALAQERSGIRRLEGRAAETLARHRSQIEAYEAFAAEMGVPPAVLALSWLLHQPGITAPIIGPRTREQLTSALGALDTKLDAGALAQLDLIFPGHKPAPEEYAW
ncbi:aldo/keto reductase [Bradyrhizobium sp. SZCCHNS1054]|uniref:aldo/keto reductase n=1 Tax=Bradyrhizobium sp. SZCCHNS1054 TaxID=3057301 RepID=UPI00291637C2|nr:aldo/keto reductase [Bradyrhizobium sp. SZCCHNS1054]